MKKNRLTLIAAALLITALLTGCGGTATAPMTKAEAAPMNGASYMDSGMAYTSYAAADEYAPMEMEADTAYKGMAGGASYGESSGDPGEERADTYDKIIYSGSANVETIRFDETVEQVYGMIERFGGFLESSYVTGRNYYSTYYNNTGYRNAEFVIRVPRENFSALRGSLDSLGSVTYSSVEAQNITSAYRDTESRLKAYRVEEERLLDMLQKAEYVEDMLSIEDRLSSVRYNIESLTTTLTNWDSKVNYSTMRLSIQEVKELTEEKPIARTFGEDLREGLSDSLDWLGTTGKNVVIFLVSAVPLLLIPAVIVVVIVLIVRSRRRKKRKNTALQGSKDVKDDN